MFLPPLALPSPAPASPEAVGGGYAIHSRWLNVPGCTWPSQAIMAARPVAFEAARAPERCRAGELQHSRRKVCARRMSRGPCLCHTGDRTLGHACWWHSHLPHTRTRMLVALPPIGGSATSSATSMRFAIAYVPTENGRVILPSCEILRYRHDGSGGAWRMKSSCEHVERALSGDADTSSQLGCTPLEHSQCSTGPPWTRTEPTSVRERGGEETF